MPANIFTTKLLDIVINPEAETDILNLKRIFLVMDFADQDLRTLILKDE
jgi:hypothetical protein